MAKSIVISCRLCQRCWHVVPEGKCEHCKINAAARKLRSSKERRAKNKYDITAEEVRAAFEYDPLTGDFVRRGKRTVLGTLNAGGYLMISLLGWTFRAHRLAWMYVHGRWPSGKIDHINGSRIDNRIENLREVSDAVNCQNLRAPKSHNRSGYLGVVWRPLSLKWAARITVDKKIIHLGLFDSAEAASAAYWTAKRRMHEGCSV